MIFTKKNVILRFDFLNEKFLNKKVLLSSNRQSRETGSAWFVTDCAKGVEYPKMINAFCFKMDSSTIQNAHPNNTKCAPSEMLLNCLLYNEFMMFIFDIFGEDCFGVRCANLGVTGKSEDSAN